MDWSLIITIGLIFLGTLIGGVLRFRTVDPCLRSFRGFPVTLERATGKVVWGVMSLESTGMELIYQSQVQDEKHLESSYILYASEYPDIQAIFRYSDELTGANKAARDADIERTFHPKPWRRLRRGLRNLLSIASSSLTEVFGILVGRARKPAGRHITDQGEAHLNRIGAIVLGQASAPYDPLLERHIGHKVVIELVEGDEVHEHVGIFKNYSADFFEVLDVRFPQRKNLMFGEELVIESTHVGICVEEGAMIVENCGEAPLLLQSLTQDGEELLVNVVVDGGERVELHPEERFLGGSLQVQLVRELDMVIPRSRAVLRHHAEQYRTESLPEAVYDIIFDVGIALTPDRRAAVREARLREQLAGNPADASSAASLAAILLARQEFGEAEKWLQTALRLEDSLPDNGRRARMQLRELRRRLRERG